MQSHFGQVNTEGVLKTIYARELDDTVGRFCPPISLGYLPESLTANQLLNNYYKPSSAASRIVAGLEKGSQNVWLDEFNKAAWYEAHINPLDAIYIQVYAAVAGETLISALTQVVREKFKVKQYRGKQERKTKDPRTPIQRAATNNRARDLCNSLLVLGLEQDIDAVTPLPSQIAQAMVDSIKDADVQQELAMLSKTIGNPTRFVDGVAKYGDDGVDLETYIESVDEVDEIVNPGLVSQDKEIFDCGFASTLVPRPE